MAAISHIKNTLLQPCSTEYMVYAYKGFEKEKLGFNRWELLGAMKDPKVAIENAETLFTTRQYDKIEIQKKVFNDKKGIYTSTVVKTFEEKSSRHLLTLITGSLLVIFSVGILLLERF